MVEDIDKISGSGVDIEVVQVRDSEQSVYVELPGFEFGAVLPPKRNHQISG